MMEKQEIVEMLSQLYRLKYEGKNVDSLIAEMEKKLKEMIEQEE